MSTKSKTLAKSLHTVTAIVQVARLLKSVHVTYDNAEAVACALIVLGYEGASDPYDLAARALASL